MGMCTVSVGTGASLTLPILAHIEQRHVLAGFAPIEEFPRGSVLDHQNTNFCAAVALISGSNDGLEQAFADPFGGIDPAHQDGIHDGRLADDGEQASAEAQAIARSAQSYTGSEPVTAIASYSPKGAARTHRESRIPPALAGTARRLACGERRPLRVNIDRLRRGAEQTQAGGQVAGAAADLEHACRRRHAQRLQNAPLNFGASIDWPKPMGMGASANASSRYSGGTNASRGTIGQSIEHARVENFPGAYLLIHHLLPSGQCIHDFSSAIKAADYGQFRQATRAPCAILLHTMVRDVSSS